MRPGEKAVELAITAAVAAGTVFMAIGGKPPSATIQDHENRIRVIEEHQPKLDTAVAVLQNDVSYIKDGVDELRGHKGRAR